MEAREGVLPWPVPEAVALGMEAEGVAVSVRATTDSEAVGVRERVDCGESLG